VLATNILRLRKAKGSKLEDSARAKPPDWLTYNWGRRESRDMVWRIIFLFNCLFNFKSITYSIHTSISDGSRRRRSQRG